jgi:hypothetical protein
MVVLDLEQEGGGGRGSRTKKIKPDQINLL